MNFGFDFIFLYCTYISVRMDVVIFRSGEVKTSGLNFNKKNMLLELCYTTTAS